MLKKISKLLFIGGGVLIVLSLLSLFLGRGVWVILNGITSIYMELSVAIVAFILFKSNNMPHGHRFAWAAIAASMFLFAIGTTFRLKISGNMGHPTDVFVKTDYIFLLSYILLTGAYYIFQTRAGAIIDESDKLKIVWGAGIFLILVVALIIAIEATSIFGKTTSGMLINIFYISLDMLMILIAITYQFAFYDGKISIFYKYVSSGIFIWLLVDFIFVFRGSYGKSTSFVLAWGKTLPVFILLYAEKFYESIFSE